MFRTAITGRKPTRYINVSVYFVHINVGKVACNCKQSDRLRHDVQRSEFVWSQQRPNHVSRYVTRGPYLFWAITISTNHGHEHYRKCAPSLVGNVGYPISLVIKYVFLQN